MKYLPYGRQDIDENDIRQVIKVLRSGWITQGPKIAEFEKALCVHTGAKYAVAVSSGTAALHVAALASGLKKGDEAITSPVTFVASANCVLYAGARPVFADIDEDTVNIDPEEINRKVNRKTKAIIPVHFAGQPCDLRSIRNIARENGLAVIEDASHALGALYRGSKIGSCEYSDMTVFSFHPVKHITTGEGGAVTTNRRDLYKKLLMFRNHGITRDTGRRNEAWYYEQQLLGFNYRITDFQCALGLSQLKRLGRFVEKRKKISGYYNDKLLGIEGLTLPYEAPDVISSWHLYCVRLKDAAARRRAFDRLRKAGIGTQVHYIPVHLQPYYRKNLGYKKGDYPKAERHYSGALTLPVYPELELTDLKRIVKTIKEVVA